MDIKTIFEDEGLIVISKPPALEVSQLPKLGWPAHRLDKDTSGLMILAKNQPILKKLQAQFKARQVVKKYLALVLGNPPSQGKINGYLARDPSRKKPFKLLNPMLTQARGKPRLSISYFQKIQTLDFNHQSLALLEVKIKTGRTHQIRIHLASQGWPIIGDKVYGTKSSQKISQDLGTPRQFLHASYLAFHHPLNQRRLIFKNDLPRDLRQTLNLCTPEVHRLVVISGASGAGKDSVIQNLLKKYPQIKEAATYTTRPARPEEAEGQDHFFINNHKFQQLYQAGEILEKNFYNHHWYGTAKSALEKAWQKNHIPILEIDVQGVKQLKKIFPGQLITIFIWTSQKDLRNRLEKRGDVSPAQIEERLKISQREIKQKGLFDLAVENRQNRLAKTVDQILDFLRKKAII